MVLTDDSFSTIVAAIKEGRGIYDNIKKFVLYNLTGNTIELIVIMFGIATSLPFPLTAMQILLTDLGTEIFPSLSLGLDSHDPKIMERKPRKREERMVNKHMLLNVLEYATVAATGIILVFLFYLQTSEQKAQTMAYVTLGMFQVFNIFNIRHSYESIFKIGIFSNKYAIYAISASIALMLCLIYVPTLQQALRMVPLSPVDWLVVLLVSSSTLLIFETKKYFYRKHHQL